MISIADAIILAGLLGLLGFLWHERFRMEALEEENDELWDYISSLAEDFIIFRDSFDEEKED